MRAAAPSRTRRLGGSRARPAARPSTRRSYEQLLVGYLIPYFGGRTLRLIQVTDIERFRTDLAAGSRLDQTGVHRSTSGKRGLVSLRLARSNVQSKRSQAAHDQQGADHNFDDFQLCNAQSMGGRNPARYVEPRETNGRLKSSRWIWMSDSRRVVALREAAIPATYRDGKLITNNYRLMISFAVFTGCRLGEILGARAGATLTGRAASFTFAGLSGKVTSNQPKTRTSYRRYRTPDFSIEGTQSVAAGLPQRSSMISYFPNLDGKPMSYWNLMSAGFYPALKRAGIRENSLP